MSSGMAFSADNEARTGYLSDSTAPAPEVINGATSEGFVDITNLPGWIMDNQSNPVGTTNWFQGNDAVFAAQAGGSTEYIAANYNNTSGSNICNWLIMPDLGYLQTVSFWTRTATGSTYPDRLVVVHSPTGGTTTGDCFGGFGDFTNTLTEINPGLNSGGYPQDWTQFTSDVNGTGRVAFVYWVADGGPFGNNSDYIGIDSVEWVAGAPEADVQLTISNNAVGQLGIGDAVNFTLTATNNGPGDANNTAVSATLSSGLDYVSDDCGMMVAGSNLSWNIGTLANGGSAVCNVVANVSGYGSMSMSGSVSADETDNVPANNNGVSGVTGPTRVIPTLSQYGLMLLLLVMVGFAGRRLVAK